MGADRGGSARQLDGVRDLAGRLTSREDLVGFLAVAAKRLTIDAGFSCAGIALLQDDYFETVAVAGPPQLHESLTGSRFELAGYETELESAESWGALKYVDADNSAGIASLHPAAAEHRGRLPGTAGQLYAPLNSDSGRLIGLLFAEISDTSARPGIAAQKFFSDIAEIVAGAIEQVIEPEPAAAPPQPPRHVDSGVATALAVAPDHSSVTTRPPDRHADPETGLPNRQGLEEAFNATLARLRQDGSTAAVLYCVLEEYDSIAETHGHEVALEVLQGVTKRLQDSVRAYDVVARVSNNTMAIVADHIAPHDTSTLASRLRRTLAKVHIVRDEVVRVRGSVGVALITPDNADAEPDTLISAAQAAADAERNGANGTYVLYSRYNRPAALAPLP